MLKDWTGWTSFALFLFLLVITFFINPNLGAGGLVAFMTIYAPLVFCALGESIVITTSGIDLSVGGVVGLVNVTTIALVGAGWKFLEVTPKGGLYTGGAYEGLPFLLAAMVGILAGLIIGLLNGVAVGFMGVPPLIATLASFRL